MTTCDSGKCTCQAIYRCKAKTIGNKSVSYVRDYCPTHTRQLTEGLAKMLQETYPGMPLHEYLDVEHIQVMTNA